jgi:hypothetical protein
LPAWLLFFKSRRKLSLSRKLPCSKCAGTGSKSGKRTQCDTCHGTGVQVMIRPIGPGMVQQIQQPCKDCSGNGFCAKPSKRRKGLAGGAACFQQTACMNAPAAASAAVFWQLRPATARLHTQFLTLASVSSTLTTPS